MRTESHIYKEQKKGSQSSLTKARREGNSGELSRGMADTSKTKIFARGLLEPSCPPTPGKASLPSASDPQQVNFGHKPQRIGAGGIMVLQECSKPLGPVA